VRLKILFTSNDTSKQIVGHNGEAIYSAEIKPDSIGKTNIRPTLLDKKRFSHQKKILPEVN
jgi:hypothetical protein